MTYPVATTFGAPVQYRIAATSWTATVPLAPKPSPWDGPWRIVDGLAGARYWTRWLKHGKHRALVRGPVVVEPDYRRTSMTSEQFDALLAKATPAVTGAGPCPACNAEWSYQWTMDGWDGSLPCSRALIYIECPDCGGRFR